MRTLFILLLAAIILISGCSKSAESIQSLSEQESKGIANKVSSGDTNSHGQIIRNAELELMVESVAKSHQRLDSMLHAIGAFLASESEVNSDDRIMSTLVIRVPENKLEILLSYISSIAKQVDLRKVNSQDVSSQLIDLAARIHAKREMESRFLELVKRTGKLSDLIELEYKLADVRGEIETMQAQLISMKDQVCYSTLTVSIYELIPADVNKEPRFFFSLLNAFMGGWRFCLSVIIALAHIWPFLLVASIVTFVLHKKNLLRISKALK